MPDKLSPYSFGFRVILFGIVLEELLWSAILIEGCIDLKTYSRVKSLNSLGASNLFLSKLARVHLSRYRRICIFFIIL